MYKRCLGELFRIAEMVLFEFFFSERPDVDVAVDGISWSTARCGRDTAKPPVPRSAFVTRQR